MYLKKRKDKNGDIYLSIMEKYYDSQKKCSRERTIEGIGFVSQLKNDYEDPIAHFAQRAKNLTSEKKSARSKTVTIDTTMEMGRDEDNFKNVGYAILKKIYRQLELDLFWRWKTRNRKVKYNPELIFRLLVISRILYPGSKKEAFDKKISFSNQSRDFPLMMFTMR
jgi:hypothetical protein